MATRKAVAWIERLTWAAIYGGLLMFIIALRLGQDDHEVAWWLGAFGVLLAGTGFALVYVRSRLKEISA